MNDLLFQLSIRSDNQTLQSLSKTALWNSIKTFAQEEYFWYRRTEHLVGRDLPQMNGNWKEAYYLLLDEHELTRRVESGLVLRNYIAVSILILLGRKKVLPNFWPTDRHLLQALSFEVLRDRVYYSTLRELVRSGMIDPRARTSKNQSILDLAVEGRDVELVKILLTNERVDPRSDRVFYVIPYARSSPERTEVLKLLLEDGRADPVPHAKNILESVLPQRDNLLMRALLEDSRIRFSDLDIDRYNRERMMNLALEKEDTELVKLLEK